MKSSELRAMQRQFLSGNYTARESSTPTVPAMATERQISYLDSLRRIHPDHANTMGITVNTKLASLTRKAASDAISYITREGR